MMSDSSGAHSCTRQLLAAMACNANFGELACACFSLVLDSCCLQEALPVVYFSFHEVRTPRI
jgi:hypothetical protein